MNRKLAFVPLLSFLALMSVFQSVKAATIPSASLDKETYFAGETGYITVSVYNDENDVIRVTEVSASINYYYTDGTVYVQKFFSNAELPEEITAGQTESFLIPISLPTNIAHGYTNLIVEARTDLWNEPSEHWYSSDRPSYSLKMYVQSPYQPMYEDSQAELTDIAGQLEEEKLLAGNLNSMVIMFASTTLVFAIVAAFLGFHVFSRRAKAVQQPA